MSKELKPLVFSINDLAYVDEIMVKKNFDNPHDHAVYKATEVDKVLAQKDFEIDRLKEFNAFLKNRISNGDVGRSILVDDLEQKDKEIAKLKEERRWRKFPDEKPKWGEEVLVVDDASKQYIVRFSHDMKWISWGKMNTCESNCVKYWMPQPSEPKEAK